MKRLIVTGDDFGLAAPINEAIELAHRDGILTTTSLMVAAPAAADAVERARSLPGLHVGLHVVLVEGRPALPADAVPALVDAAGDFHENLFASGVRFFFRPEVRRQLRAEIRAQFEGFRATGLELDHANAHNHMQLHPTVLSLILEVGREYGLGALRVPYEPPRASWRAFGDDRAGRWLRAAALSPWTAILRARLRRAGVRSNDYVFGMRDAGHLDESRVLRILAELPDGVTELFFHAATRRCAETERYTPDFQHEDELAALMSARVREEIARRGIRSVAFADL